MTNPILEKTLQDLNEKIRRTKEEEFNAVSSETIRFLRGMRAGLNCAQQLLTLRMSSDNVPMHDPSDRLSLTQRSV